MAKNLNNFKLPRWNELPSIPLYLDQVLSLIDEWSGQYLGENQKRVVTKTMINNYVKLKYINAPVNKKYSRDSVAKLFVIATLKPVFAIEEIKDLMDLAINYRESVGDAYDEFCGLVENAVDCAFRNQTYERPNNPGDPRNICWSACNAFACQLYVKQIYLGQMEKFDRVVSLEKSGVHLNAKNK